MKKIKNPIEIDTIVEKYTKEEKIIIKSLRILEKIGEPKFIVSENRFKTNLKAKDENKLWYVRGLLESLITQNDKENHGKN